MCTRLSTIVKTFTLIGLSTVSAFAVATCGEPPLTAAQVAYLDDQELPIAEPTGEVPQIARCDVNFDNRVDKLDLKAIRNLMRHNSLATHPDDPMDFDGNGIINVKDAQGCRTVCTLDKCIVSGHPHDEEIGEDGEQLTEQEKAEAPMEQAVDTYTESADCYQVDDFDGDGKADFAGIFEYTGEEERGGDWTLSVVVLSEDSSGNTQHITYPYSGKQTDGQLMQHLSLQLPGEVDLNPGLLTLDKPAVVSYRDGEPAVIYYWVDGQVSRAFYGIDD